MAYFNRGRFRRRNNGFWLPLPGAPAIGNIAALAAGASTVTSDDLFGGNIDEPMDQTNFPAARMLDYQYQGYVIKRLVGSVFVWCTGSADTSPVLVNVAIGAARVDDAGAILDGTSFNTFTNTNISRLQKRVVWTRTWALCPFQAVGGYNPQPTFPSANVSYGSVKEGSFLDTKGTSLRVQLFEKAFLHFSAFNTTAAAVDINIRYKLRAYGMVVRTKGK